MCEPSDLTHRLDHVKFYACRPPIKTPVALCSVSPGNMFVADIKGYSDFSADEWQPRPDVYLASVNYPQAICRWLLVICGSFLIDYLCYLGLF